MNKVEQVMIQDLSNQIANLSADRAAWRARALVAENQLEELAEDAEDEDTTDDPGDDTDTEVNDE